MDYTSIESHHPIFPINIQQLLATVLIPKNFRPCYSKSQILFSYTKQRLSASFISKGISCGWKW